MPMIYLIREIVPPLATPCSANQYSNPKDLYNAVNVCAIIVTDESGAFERWSPDDLLFPGLPT